jgi:superfamily I DNA/RNA helicase
MKYTPTEEQKKILESVKNMNIGDILVVNALAGCAKTTTIEMITKKHLNSKFLYLAFNRKIVEEGKKRLPSNTKSSTLHAFARGYSGRKKLEMLNLDLIASILEKEIKNKDEYFEVFNSLKAYQRYCISEYEMHELDALKTDIREEMRDQHQKENRNGEWLIQQRIDGVNNIETIHNHILNSDFSTFDTFLKDFVDTAHNRSFKYEYILLDESQDVSKLLAKFIFSLARSKRYKIVVVGDEHQKIYGFLGNTNLSGSLKKALPDRIVSENLTQSFRFQSGSNIEVLSNLLLNLRGEKIVGARKELGKESRNAYLSRANFPLLAMAMHQINSGQDFYLYGGINNFNIDEVRDIYNLFIYSKQEIGFPEIKTKSLKPFASFNELHNFALEKAIFELEDNVNTALFIYTKRDMVSNKDDVVYSFFNDIDSRSNENSKNILSTVHKSKGLEFETVTILRSLSLIQNSIGKWITHETSNGMILGMERKSLKGDDDIFSNIGLSRIFKSVDRGFDDDLLDFDESHFPQKVAHELILNPKIDIREEFNILYVAITRAINSIHISNVHYLESLQFLQFLNQNREELEKLKKGEESSLFYEVEDRVGKTLHRKGGFIYNGDFISRQTLTYFWNLVF